MKRRLSVRATRLTAVTLFAIALAGCSSGPAATATGPAGSGLPPTAAPGPTLGGGPASDEGLCPVFTPELAVAALGGSVEAPTGGEVVPRPNGIYCHYAAVSDGNSNVEAQLKDMTMAEFEQLAQALNMTEPLDGVGQAGYQLDRSTMGGVGTSVLVWANGRGVTVIINASGDQQALLEAAKAIATKVLAS